MIEKIIGLLIKQKKDGVYDRLMQEKIVKRQVMFFSLSILFSILSFFVVMLLIMQNKHHVTPVTYMVGHEQEERKRIVVLPVPHQTFKNVSSWINTSIIESYSFDFLNYDEKVDKARKNFTKVGYETYLNALDASNIKSRVMENKLQVSIIPIGSPILINGGTYSDTNFWRFSVPVLISYYSGGDPVIRRARVSLLVLGVPTYENHKGLAISEFNMKEL